MNNMKITIAGNFKVEADYDKKEQRKESPKKRYDHEGVPLSFKRKYWAVYTVLSILAFMMLLVDVDVPGLKKKALESIPIQHTLVLTQDK